MDYRVWTIINGALEDDVTCASVQERNAMADELAAELADCECQWEVWTAAVTEGCSVGEWAGEEASLFASSEN